MNLNEIPKVKTQKKYEIQLSKEDKYYNIDPKYVQGLVIDLNKTTNIYQFEDGINEELKTLKRKLLNNNISDIDVDSKNIIKDVFLRTKNFNIINSKSSKIPFFGALFREGKNLVARLQVESDNFTKLIEGVEKKLAENKKNIIISLKENESNYEKIIDAYKQTSAYVAAYKVFLNQKTDEMNEFLEENKSINSLLINSEIAKKQAEIDYVKSRIHFFSEEKVKILDRVYDLNSDRAVKTNILNYITDFLQHGVEDFLRLIENLIKIEQNRQNLEYNDMLDRTYKDLYRFAKEKGLENLVKSEEAQKSFSLGYELLEEYNKKQEEVMNQVYDIRNEKSRIRDDEINKFQNLEEQKLEGLKPTIIQVDGLNI